MNMFCQQWFTTQWVYSEITFFTLQQDKALELGSNKNDLAGLPS